MLELDHRNARRVEVLRIGPQAHHRAGRALVLGALALQLLLELAAFEGQRVLLAVAVHGDFEASGQRVRHRDADAMQAAGDVVA